MAPCLTLLHSERPKLYGVLTILSAVGLSFIFLSKLTKFSGEWCTAVSLLPFSSPVRKYRELLLSL